MIPTYATHDHLADRLPFLNLSELAENDLAPVMAELAKRRANARLERMFADGPLGSFLRPGRAR